MTSKMATLPCLSTKLVQNWPQCILTTNWPKIWPCHARQQVSLELTATHINSKLTANLVHLLDAGCSRYLSADDLRDGNPAMSNLEISLELTATHAGVIISPVCLYYDFVGFHELSTCWCRGSKGWPFSYKSNAPPLHHAGLPTATHIDRKLTANLFHF